MPLLIKDITNYLEEIAPLSLQEDYDNSGLLIGQKSTPVNGALICVDVTEAILDEALQYNCNLIIAHHPLIFSGIKKLNGNNWVERTVIKAIKNDIAIYAIHTNLDNMIEGVNEAIANKIGLHQTRILQTKVGLLRKLVCFCPVDKANMVREALFTAGAGRISNYDSCSFNSEGKGTFRGNYKTKPYVGKKLELHTENEIRIETVFPDYLESSVLTAMIMAHPYEEVAYDIYTLNNHWANVGAGIIGSLAEPMDEIDFFNLIKTQFHCSAIRHTALKGRKIKKVALCGGAGSFLLKDAINNNADIFITSDFKYHQFFDADNQIVIADIGHYESEQFTKDLLFNKIQKKFSNFALYLSKINTNPIHYY